jgi:hypothetical protein
VPTVYISKLPWSDLVTCDAYTGASGKLLRNK